MTTRTSAWARWTSGVDDEDVEQLTIEVVNPPGGPALYGRVVETWLTGVKEKTIGGKLRNHVAEGSTAVMLNVTVEWLVWELREIYGSRAKLTGDDAFAELCVGIASDPNMAEPAWVSMIDDEQDAHFPQAISCWDRSSYSGNRSGRRQGPVPREARGHRGQQRSKGLTPRQTQGLHPRR